MDEDTEFQNLIKERFAKLPKVVQNAITSADISKRLREVANKHQLHLDQWETLENEVRMTLLAIKPSEDLAKNIKEEVVVTSEVAESLAEDISRIVFEPIREELERELDHPDAQAKTETGVEQAASFELSASRQEDQASAPPETRLPDGQGSQQTVQSSVTPAPIAPIPTPPDSKAVRTPVSAAYRPGETSVARKDVINDPYREPPR